MKYTKQDLIDGKICIYYQKKYHNEINELFKQCFPEHYGRFSAADIHGLSMYYYANMKDKRLWDCANHSKPSNMISVTYDKLDLFELPEKWYVIPTTLEQTLDVCCWFDKSEFGMKDHPHFYEDDHKKNVGIAFGGICEGNVLHNTKKSGLTQITIEQFYKYVLKKYLIYTIKDLTEGKVCLFSDGCTKEELQKVLKAAYPNTNKIYYNHYNVSKYHWTESGYYWYNNNSGCEKLLKQSIKVFLDELKNNEMKEDKKIIGYKAPTDLYGGSIKKGTVYENKVGGIYTPNWTTGFSIPKEIAETWEAIYEDKLYLYNPNGSKAHEIIIDSANKFAKIEKFPFNLDFWKALRTINNHDKAEVYLGCGAKLNAVNTMWKVDKDTVDEIIKRLS